MKEPSISLNDFANMWSCARGILYVVDYMYYDELYDAVEDGLTDAREIFRKVGCAPVFSIWKTEIEYAPCGYLLPKYSNAPIYNFIVIPSGIIVFLKWEEVRNYKEKE